MPEPRVPEIELRDGNRVPQFGLGVWKLPPEDTERVVGEALARGYRHIDTAQFYDNEREVGRAIAASGIPRGEVFVTTKLWISDHHDPVAAVEQSLERLGLDRVDLYLIHWPVPLLGTAFTAWKGLIEVAERGLSDSIGVANFEIEHLEELLRETDVVPSVNQIELHPRNQRRVLRDFCAEQGIAVEAWAPLGQDRAGALDNPAVLAAAAAHRKTPAQVVLRWHVQQGVIVFPKTSRPERMTENIDVFDFELSAEEMRSIAALDEQRGLGIDLFTYVG